MTKKFLLHSIPWFVFMAYISFSNREFYLNLETGVYILKQGLSVASLAAIFYLNYFFLVPPFLIRKRRIPLYIIGVIFLFIINGLISLGVGKFLDFIIGEPLFYEDRRASLFLNLLTPALFIILSTGIRISAQYYKDRYKKLALHDQMQQVELDLLKAQVNPHFLYNAFNTIYALSKAKSSKTPDAILHLSNVMRYTTYKATNPRVSIHDELAFLHDYISFQKLRISDPESKIDCVVQSPESDFKISPTLLLTFVENAFKHTDLVHLKHPIKIRFTSYKNAFSYEVINEIHPYEHNNEGVGLVSLKRMLDMTYPGLYELKTTITGELFHASLYIKIEYED